MQNPLSDQLRDLIARLCDVGVLTADVGDELVGPSGPQPADCESALQWLCERGLISQFQRDEIAAGRLDQLVVAGYVKLEVLGQGGMGAVFKARRRADQQLVALKMTPPSLRDRPEALKRLRRELKAAQQLAHPNAIETYTFEDTPQGPVLVMQFVEGLDLHQFVDQHGRLVPDEAIDFLQQAAEGLEHAHGRGVIHRDVKPSNLLLGDDGRVRVLDFGVARLAARALQVEASTLTALTQAGDVLGTVDFMAPEQAFDSKSVDARADIYSLGCTLYFLLMGTPPFRGETAVETMLAHSEAPIPPLRFPASRRLRRGLVAIYQRMMAKEPDARYSSMAEVVQAIDRLKSSLNAAQARLRMAVTGGVVAVALLSILLVGQLRSGRLLPPPQVSHSTLVAHARRLPTGESRRPSWRSVDWLPGNADNVMPGIIPRPARLPGLDAWQMHTTQPRSYVTRIAWSPDSRWLYYGTNAGELRLHDLTQREVVGVLATHEGEMPAIAVHPSRDIVATGLVGEKVIRLWNRRGESLGVLAGHADAVRALAWSPEGRTLASCGDNTVRLWNEDGQPGPVLIGQTRVTDVAWHPHGTQLASAAGDGTVQIWNRDGSKLILLEHDDGAVYCVAWHPAGTHLVSAGKGTSLRIWDLATSQATQFGDHPNQVFQVGWSPDGNWLASRTSWPEKTLRIWRFPDNGDREPAAVIQEAWSFAWHVDSFLVAVGKGVGLSLVGVDAITYEEIYGDARVVDILELDWHPNGQRFLSAHSDGTIGIWDREGRRLHTVSAHDGSAQSARWSRDGKRFASGGVDKVVRLWDERGNRLQDLHGSAAGIARSGLAWSADSRWIAAGAHDGKVHLWSFDGQDSRVFEGHAAPIASLDWSPDGDFIASIDTTAKIKLWDPRGKSIAQINAAGGFAGSAAWSPDSQTLATMFGGTVELWDRAGQRVNTAQIEGNLIHWSPTGDQLLAGGGRLTRIWNRRDGTISDFRKHTLRAFTLAWHPTQDLVLSGGADGEIQAGSSTIGGIEWVSCNWEGKGYATLDTAGKLIAGDPRTLEQNALFSVRDKAGNIETLKLSEFLRRRGIDLYD